MADVCARWDALDLFVRESEPAHDREAKRATLRQTFRRDATRLAEQLCDLGGTDTAEIEAVLAFAGALGPAPHERLRHRIVRGRMLMIDRGHERSARSAPARLKRDLESRVRWQQWDRYGL